MKGIVSELITLSQPGSFPGWGMVLCVVAKEATTMPDYMRALHQRFGRTSPNTKALEDAIEQTEKQLKEHLDIPRGNYCYA